jgi:hypothetical protein
MAGFTKRQPMVVSWIAVSRAKAVSAFGMTKGARDMLSTPPAIRRSASPAAIARAATRTASIPEPQSRFTVVPGTPTGRPESSAACRATLRQSSPAWFAQPIATSPTAAQSTLGFRAMSARRTAAARSSGRTEESAPP